jgi:hypothetical protein
MLLLLAVGRCSGILIGNNRFGYCRHLEDDMATTVSLPVVLWFAKSGCSVRSITRTGVCSTSCSIDYIVIGVQNELVWDEVLKLIYDHVKIRKNSYPRAL